MEGDADRDAIIDIEVPEVDAELVAFDEEAPETGRDSEVESEPDDPTDEFLDGITYAEVPNPFVDEDLFAHDPEALSMALADPGPQVRTLVYGGSQAPDRYEGGRNDIRNVEELALKRAKIARRSRSTRRIFWRITAVGLPFTVASLLGAIGLVVGRIPAVGSAVGEFVFTAGSSVGGLPLGIAIAGIPSLWIFWKTKKRSDLGIPPRPSKSGKRLNLQINQTSGPEYVEFLEEIQPLIEESRQLSLGRRSVAGGNARRLETLFHSMVRVSRRYGIHPAASMYGDFESQMWRAGALARRRIGFIALRIRRSPTKTADITAPYSAGESQRAVGSIAGFLRVPAGILAALALFLVAGIYRLSPDEAEVVRPNQAYAFTQILDVFSLTDFSRDQLSSVFPNSVKAVDGPGWFWSWPTPLTQREHINLSRRKVEVESFLGLRVGGSTETVAADVIFSVLDTGKWVFLGRSADADQEVRDRLSQLLADHIADSKERRAALPNRPVNITEALKDEMDDVLTNFVLAVNKEMEVEDLGIQVDSAGGYSFPTFPR